MSHVPSSQSDSSRSSSSSLLRSASISATSSPAGSHAHGDLPLRLGGWASAAALVLGSVLFLMGGRVHPAVDSSLAAGPGGFFGAFAATVHGTHGWHGMHMLILIGPLFWALGAPTLVETIRPQGRILTGAGRSALLLSAGLWAVAFVLDGFGAPVYAEALASADSPEVSAALLTAFRANAVMMSRLGLVSWVVGGVGMMMLGGSLLARDTRTMWRILVGVAGLAIGSWPLLAALEGEYAAGPFTSRFWLENALSAGLWYIALAICAFSRSRADPSPLLPTRNSF